MRRGLGPDVSGGSVDAHSGSVGGAEGKAAAESGGTLSPGHFPKPSTSGLGQE